MKLAINCILKRSYFESLEITAKESAAKRMAISRKTISNDPMFAIIIAIKVRTERTDGYNSFLPHKSQRESTT